MRREEKIKLEEARAKEEEARRAAKPKPPPEKEPYHMGSAEKKALKARFVAILGPLRMFDVSERSIECRTESWKSITLAQLNALAIELGTEAINFDFGSSGEPGYSEVTPGTEASPGWIEVMFPIKGAPSLCDRLNGVKS